MFGKFVNTCLTDRIKHWDLMRSVLKELFLNQQESGSVPELFSQTKFRMFYMLSFNDFTHTKTNKSIYLTEERVHKK